MFYSNKISFLFIFFIINNLSMYQWVKELPDDIENSKCIQGSECINENKAPGKKKNIIIDDGMPYDNKQPVVIDKFNNIPPFDGVMRNIKICRLNKKTLGLQSNSASSSDSDDSYAKAIQKEEIRKLVKRQEEDAVIMKKYDQQREFEKIVSNFENIIKRKEETNAQFFYLSTMYSGYDQMATERYIKKNHLSQFYKNLLSALNITKSQFNLTLCKNNYDGNIYKFLDEENFQLKAVHYFNQDCFRAKNLKAYDSENLDGVKCSYDLFNERFMVDPKKTIKDNSSFRGCSERVMTRFLANHDDATIKYFDFINDSLRFKKKLTEYNIFFNVLYLLKKTELYSYYDNKIFAEIINIAEKHSKNFIGNSQLLEADNLFSYKFEFFHKWHHFLRNRYKGFFAFIINRDIYEKIDQEYLKKKLCSLCQYNFIEGYDNKTDKALCIKTLRLIMFARIFKNPEIISNQIERIMTVECFNEEGNTNETLLLEKAEKELELSASSSSSSSSSSGFSISSADDDDSD